MALDVELIPNGLHHAKTVGTITVGPAKGQVPALGNNQLMLLALPFDKKVITQEGFEEQFYIFTKPLDANVTDIRLDAVQFEYPVDAPPNLRLRVDISAAPAAVEIWLEAHHSAGR